MSLPIDAEAIAAQDKAEHEYGERLMTVAEMLATVDEAESVTTEHIERAMKMILGTMAEGAGCEDSELPSLLDMPNIGPQRATPAAPAQLKAQANQLRCICAEKYGSKE